MPKAPFTQEEAGVVLQALAVGVGMAACEGDIDRLKMGIDLAHKMLHLLADAHGADYINGMIKDGEAVIREKILGLMLSGEWGDDEDDLSHIPDDDGEEVWN